MKNLLTISLVAAAALLSSCTVSYPNRTKNCFCNKDVKTVEPAHKHVIGFSDAGSHMY